MTAVKAVLHTLILCQVILAVSAETTTTKKPNIRRCLTNKIKCDADFCVPARDITGCPYCACPVYTCANVDCAPGDRCVMKKNKKCFIPPCLYEPVCEPIEECPMIKCAPLCRPGVGPDGCPACDCPKTCQRVECPDDQKCVMEGGSRPRCVPKAKTKCHGEVVCAEPCVADVGPGGCFTKCSCPKTCKNVKCKVDEECELVEVKCFRAPCFPVPTCLPKHNTCSGSPNVSRCFVDKFSILWTYNSSTQVCHWFPHYGCIPSPNTFKKYTQCMTTCLPKCRIPTCMDNCYLKRKAPGLCPECACPCQTVKCPPGQECRLRKRNCLKGVPCPHKAYCTPVVVPTTCPPHVCPITCPRGFALDDNGCRICRCID